ncbi:polycystin-2-like [Saccostrea echinata]|uniref:polycystin-2-like n=1 Tax=Saccostrea echinata TaxID=191078 RepID=UPI002A834350|nr:polycystin-2-like [Saccostrea echinata]
MLFIAAIFSFILKNPATNRSIEFDIKLLKKYCAFHSSKKSKHYVELVGSVFHKTRPLSDSKVVFMRKRHKEVASAKKSFQNLMISLVLAGSVLAIGFIEFDVNAYYLQNNIRNYLVSDGYGQFGFSAVNNTDDFYKWMTTTFIPTCYPLRTYNGEKLDILGEQMFGDLANLRVGPARIRQVRMPERKCKSTLVSTIYPCIDSYELTGEDKGTYCPKWQQRRPDCSDSGFIPQAWSYIDSSAIFGTPVSAVYNTYSGGGYFFLLDEERAQSERQVQNAKDNNWIDRHTRAVMTEFTLYNPNINTFINAVLVLEFLEQGFAMPCIHLRPFTRSLKFQECRTSLQASFVLFVVYFIFLFVDIVNQLITDCRNVIQRVWFWVDVLFALTSACSIVLFIIRKNISDKTEKMFYDQQYTGENNFINYYQIVVLNSAIQVVLGVISFIAFLRISRAFEYSKRLSVFWRVISNSARPLLGFFIVFGITLCAFASMIYLRFGKFVNSFRNMATVFGSLANTLIGKNNVVILMNASPVFALFFYFTYGVSVIFLLLNIFAAILNETIDIVKNRNKRAGHVFGISDYTLASVKDIISLISTAVSRSKETKNDEIRYGEARQNIDTHAVVHILRRLFQTYQRQVKKESTRINNYVISHTMDDDDGEVENKTTEESIEGQEDLEINTQKMFKYI